MIDTKDEDLSVVERQAFNLAQSGIQLDQARLEGSDEGTLAQALEHNLQVWIDIGTLIKSPESQLTENVRDNILKLQDFIADTTMKHGVSIPESTLNTLININLQISEGLLEGANGRND